MSLSLVPGLPAPGLPTAHGAAAPALPAPTLLDAAAKTVSVLLEEFEHMDPSLSSDTLDAFKTIAEDLKHVKMDVDSAKEHLTDAETLMVEK